MPEQATGNRQQATGNGLTETATALRRGADIAERLLALAATIVAFTRKLPRDVVGRHVASQIVRSGTSAGANYDEARAAESRADFIHKVRIAAKEMRETIFWLKGARPQTRHSDRRQPTQRVVRLRFHAGTGDGQQATGNGPVRKHDTPIVGNQLSVLSD